MGAVDGEEGADERERLTVLSWFLIQLQELFGKNEWRKALMFFTQKDV